MNIGAAIDVLARRRGGQVVVPTMSVLDLWAARASDERDLPCQGFMGGGSALGLGIQLARPDVPVWILDGDGSLAMQLGSLLTIADARPRRFLHVVFHNGVYESSGGQPLIAEGRVSFADLALGAGYVDARAFRDVASFDAELDALLEIDGPVLVELYTTPRGAGPPPPQGAAATGAAQLRGFAARVKRRLARARRGAPRPSLDLAVNWPRVYRSLRQGRERSRR